MYELIQHQEVGAGGASSITFSDIPQIYTGLYLLMSLRSTAPGDATGLFLRLNSDTSNYTSRRLYGYATSRASDTNVSHFIVNSSGSTSNSFASVGAYIPNYASSAYKSLSFDGVGETNSANVYIGLGSMLWSVTDPVTSILLDPENATANFVQYSSATLYGVGRRQGIGRAPLAIGGYAAYDNGYWYHSFPSSGSFEPFVDMDVEYLVIAGGGGGGHGGGGGGGYRSSVSGELSGGGASAESSLSLISGTSYPVTVGAGGTRSQGITVNGTSGSNSVFSTITSTGGGRGGSVNDSGSDLSGGSGGGSGGNGSSTSGASGTANQGYNGGNYVRDANSNQMSAGGGGAGSVGGNNSGLQSGDGGYGVSSSITGSAVARAGGGGGGQVGTASPGIGRDGGGNGTYSTSTGASGTVNTGGGGGGAGFDYPGGAGGSGIVIVRYKV